MEPGTKAKVLRNDGNWALIEVGTAVTVLHRNSTWAYVKVGSRKGFMVLKYLSYTKPIKPEPVVIGSATVHHSRHTFVNLRSSRSTNSDANVLAKVPDGAIVDLLQWDIWYCMVRYNGITGYMVTSYLERN